jgi:hypothetical protein
MKCPASKFWSIFIVGLVGPMLATGCSSTTNSKLLPNNQVVKSSGQMGLVAPVGSMWQVSAGQIPGLGQIVAVKLDGVDGILIRRLALKGPVDYSCQDGKLMVGRTPVNEAYLPPNTLTECRNGSLKAGECLVLGDSRQTATDGRGASPVLCRDLSSLRKMK